jgi:hypothetical protein
LINARAEAGFVLIMNKYSHLWIYDVKERKRLPLKFPDWYLKLIVEYNKLAPQPEEKKLERKIPVNLVAIPFVY